MNHKSLKWRLPLVACIIAAAFLLVNPPFDPDGQGPKEGKLKLGLDLQGGMHLVLRVKTEAVDVEQSKDVVDRALEVIRNRVDQFGVSEPVIQRQGIDQIVVQLPGIQDRERALDLIGKTALLEFKLVAASVEGDGISSHPHQNGSAVNLEDRVLLQGESLKDASVQFSSEWGEPVVSISFDSTGARVFGDITSKNTGRQLAIVLDGVVQSAPVINEPILSGDAQITGSFDRQSANDLAIALRAGALPAPIEIQEERTVGPSLGKDSVEQGVRATVLAGVGVIVFMLIYYLFSGMIANVALIVNILIIGGCLAYFRGTLTLPGIAGVILTIGMAVDTNVLILERIREELKIGKTVSSAITAGYKKAFSAIVDANITTLLTAIILFRFGTGPIRGFALTLAIGIVGSFFSGIFVTRVIYDLWNAIKKPKSLPMLAFINHVPHINFMRLRKGFFAISLILIVSGLTFIVVKGPAQLGIDFSGGALQEYRFEKAVDTQALRQALETIGLDSAVIQEIGSSSDIVIRTERGMEGKISALIKEEFSANAGELVRVETVGPVIGGALRSKALKAVLASLAMILLYLSWRFEFRYSIGAILALLHDAIFCLAAIIFAGRELSIPVLAAILTVVGYSVNDTIVIFDRVRENVRRGTKEGLEALVNRSVNESLSRTLLTSMTTLLVVTSLYIWGGPVINDFALTMMVGVIVGTYSTIYVASPVVIGWMIKKNQSK